MPVLPGYPVSIPPPEKEQAPRARLLRPTPCLAGTDWLSQPEPPRQEDAR